jgi:hypothetical protein
VDRQWEGDITAKGPKQTRKASNRNTIHVPTVVVAHKKKQGTRDHENTHPLNTMGGQLCRQMEERSVIMKGTLRIVPRTHTHTHTHTHAHTQTQPHPHAFGRTRVR